MSLARPTTKRRGTKRSSTTKGLGTTSITVKHQRATAQQRRVVDQCLAQAHEDGASRRVMIAVVMCITQESLAGRDMRKTGNDDIGIYQQGRNWISVSGSRQPKPATHAFLVTGPTSWKKVHGSLKNAPSPLSHAIHSVQGNADPNAYAAWEDEATQTVDAWVGNDGFGTGDTGREYAKRYEFTRGERGGTRETSWDATGRLAEEVNFRRWAAGNVLHYASDEELRAQAASIEIHGDEGFLLARPAWDWGSGRIVSEVTLRVLADRWDVMPGGVVMLSMPGPTQGRWLVKSVTGQRLDSPEVEVTLRRPVRKRPEPAHDTATTSTETGGGGSGGGLLAICRQISDQGRGYPHPDVHHGPWSNIKPDTPLDCSESVSLALHKAGMFGDRKQAIVSGQFNTWGKPGKGRDFTVWFNAEHVWIEFHSGGAIKRFDTSPHGCGGFGPRTRNCGRSDQGRFSARHWS